MKAGKCNITVELTPKEFDFLAECLLEDLRDTRLAIQGGYTEDVTQSERKFVKGLFPKFGLGEYLR